MQSRPRLQLVTPSGAIFRIESGVLVPRAPGSAPPRLGDVLQVKTIVTHEMEPGYRKKNDGTVSPRNIIHTFKAAFADVEIFAAEFGPGVSANPYLAFFLELTGHGVLELTWIGDNGVELVERISLPVAW